MEGGLIMAALLFFAVPTFIFILGVLVAFASKRLPALGFLGLGFLLGVVFCLVLTGYGGGFDGPTLALLMGIPVVLYWSLIIAALVRRKSPWRCLFSED